MTYQTLASNIGVNGSIHFQRRRANSRVLLLAGIMVAILVASFIAYPRIFGPEEAKPSPTPVPTPNPTPTPTPAPVEGTLVDIDGNSYRTIKIGNQTWMAENLRVTRLNDGTDIKLVTSGWGYTTNPEYCWYDYDPANKETYGSLYNWYVVGTGKLAPSGWHVPTEADWKALADYLGGTAVAGGKLKETGTVHWKTPNEGATDVYNFTALPGGTQNYDGTGFYGSGELAFFWSADEFNDTEAWARIIEWRRPVLEVFHTLKTYGRSVRLVKDSPSTETLTAMPPPRLGSTMFYDPINRRVMLFGGALETSTGYTKYNDLWSYDYATNTWAEIEAANKPGGLFNTPACYDPDTEQLILYGGGGSGAANQMWALSVVNDTWRMLTPPSLPSPSRWNTQLAYDEKYDKVIMFSGMAYNGGFPNDTWAYDVDENEWERMSPSSSPEGHYGHSLMYDPVSRRVIMLGGHWWDDQVPRNEGFGDGVWSYDYGSDTWTAIRETQSADQRYWSTYSVNTSSGDITVFGGTNRSGLLGDTWVIRGGEWVQLSPTVHPEARELAASTYDPINEVTLLFGGSNGLRQFNDLWALDKSGQWAKLG